MQCLEQLNVSLNNLLIIISRQDLTLGFKMHRLKNRIHWGLSPQNIYISRLMEAFIMMIMIYNGTNKATTSLKRARRQKRELGNIYKWWLDWESLFQYLTILIEKAYPLLRWWRVGGSTILVSNLIGLWKSWMWINEVVAVLRNGGSAAVVSLRREGDECQ